MSMSNVCPTCLATDGDHGFECDEVEHWDDHGTCAACGVDWLDHLISPFESEDDIELRHFINSVPRWVDDYDEQEAGRMVAE